MKKSYRKLALGLSLAMMLNFGGQVSAQKTGEINIKFTEPAPKEESQKPDPCDSYKKGEQASESFKLYYIRSAPAFKTILDSIVEKNSCLKNTVIGVEGENVIVVYGKEKQRQELERIIAVLDLPRQGIKMDMWGIIISSKKNPQQLAEVMVEINREIDRSQRLLHDTYKQFQNNVKNSLNIDKTFRDLFEDTLGYRGALDQNRISLSMIDMLLMINAGNPTESYNTAARNICKHFQQEEYKDYIEALDGKIPFGNYMEQGLHQKDIPQNQNKKTNQPLPIPTTNCDQIKNSEDVEGENEKARKAILDFALQYSYLANEPEKFNPKSLQQSAETLNSVLKPIVDAINRDVEELFIEPTLKEIQRIVGKYRHVDVDYAEVGKTSVAGLNGLESTVSSTTVSTFDETTPLRLNELLREAGDLNQYSKDLLPGQAGSYAPILSAVAALSKDNSLWRGLTSGVSMTITPSVLRNNASAELKINFTAAPQETVTEDQRGNLRPLSRIAQNNVITTVYVDTLDIFALSTFNSQTTIDGGRWPIPVIGHVWKGIFGGIPVFGDLFSLKKTPKNVQHQSIVLTNSFITPTAMGLAPLYSTPKNGSFKFYDSCVAVENYKNQLKREIKSEESSGRQGGVIDVFAPVPNAKDIEAVCGPKPTEKEKTDLLIVPQLP